MKQQLISDLDEFLTFIKSLDTLKDGIWFAPLSEGKWRIYDIVTHIMKWDDYFNNVTFPILAQRELSELREHHDYLGYNEQSIQYGKGRTKKEIIDETIQNRLIMISNLIKLEDNKFSALYLGDRGFTLTSYMTEFFTSHDKHHMKQIQDFLVTRASQMARYRTFLA
ncbi:hypothetical protein J2T13_005328 [Paenibacillus sp. DS2015]|uniref:hypothetical protein n=1 Tax=Paenibacillus sp. DS2015 TaxID=3373917 RepID=UPI003D18FE41